MSELKEFMVEFKFPYYASFLESEYMRFTQFLVITALEGFPIEEDEKGKKYTFYLEDNHYAEQFALNKQINNV